MKVNQWTIKLAAAGVISFGAVAQADEKPSHQVLTAVSSTALSGYVSTSAHWNPGKANGFAAGTGSSYLAGKGDGVNVDVVNLTVSKALDEGEWSAGYTAELWLGPDATIIGNGIGGAGGAVSLKQAYVALNVPVGNGITVKMGAFDTLLGYESANSIDNPNYSRSYGYTIEPTQHEGIVASYKVCDGLSVRAGVANTRNAALGARTGGVGVGAAQSERTYLAGISLTAPDSWGFLKGAALHAGVVDGRVGGTRPTAGGTGDITSYHVGATVPTPWESVKTGVSWDHLQIDKRAGVLTADSDAIGLYASFANVGVEKLTLNTRVEYFDNGGGAVLLGGAGVGAAGVAGNGAAEVLAVTLTADYQLWANVVSRLEYRWDHDASGGRHLPGNLNGVSGAAGVGANNAHLVALNIVYKF
ncbi:MAG: outer membrane beta-barrel protein [Limisphaerales bacterium]